MRRQRADGDADGVVSITSAAPSLSDDVARRTRRYLIQMSIRVVCFLGAVLVDHWTRWLLLLGAVVLPYVAVLLANAGGERGPAPLAGPPLAGPKPPELPPASPGPTPDPRVGAD